MNSQVQATCCRPRICPHGTSYWIPCAKCDAEFRAVVRERLDQVRGSRLKVQSKRIRAREKRKSHLLDRLKIPAEMFGQRLRELSDQALESGVPTLSADEIRERLGR